MVPTLPPSLLPNTAPVRLLAANLSPNLTLSCTVVGEGRFSWQWTDPDGNPPSDVILSNVTRTSIATFTNIRGTDGGSENETLTYICQATYSSMVNSTENSSTQAIEISPEGMLRVHNAGVNYNTAWGRSHWRRIQVESRLEPSGERGYIQYIHMQTYIYTYTCMHKRLTVRNMGNCILVKPILSSHNAGILARHERVLARVGEEVILSCEVYGYFSEVPVIIWRTSDQELINTDHPYFPFVNISTSEGDRFIQNGGSDFVPSKISTMRILINDSDFFRGVVSEC